MKKIFCILWLLLAVFQSKAAFVSFTATNSFGSPDTNYFVIIPISTVNQGDGSFVTTGLPRRVYPDANGNVITNLMQNNWQFTNRFFNFCIRTPLDSGPTTYPAGQLVISSEGNGGVGIFVTQTITYGGTNGTLTQNQITNGLGGMPILQTNLPVLTNGFITLLEASNVADAFVLSSSNSIYSDYTTKIAVVTTLVQTTSNALYLDIVGSGSGLTNAYATNAAGVLVTNRSVYIGTNYDALGTALAIGLQATNFTVSTSNTLAILSTTIGLQATNFTVSTSNALQSQIVAGSVTALQATNIATNQVFLGTNALRLASQLSAFAPTNQFDGSGAARGVTNGYPWSALYDTNGAAVAVSNSLALPVPNTFYVETNGNDATAAPGQRSKPWLTLGAALTYANTNAPGIIYVGVGSFSAVSNIVSTNIAIIGSGINRTLIYPGNTPGHPAGLVIAGGNVSIRDLTAGVVTNYGLFTWPIQWNTGTNITLERLTVNGNSDAVYFTVMTNPVSGLMRDCTVNFGYDGFTQNAQHSNSVFAYDRVDFNDFSDQAFQFHPDRAVLIQNSFNYFRDCTFNVTNKNTDGVDDLTDVIAVGIYNIKGQATLLSGNTFNCWWQFGVDNGVGGVGNNLGENNIMGIYANPSQTVTSYQPLDTNSIPVNDNHAPDLVGGVLKLVNTNQSLFGRGGNITGLNASQLSSGTVPTAREGSGTANNTTFLRGDQSWQILTNIPIASISNVVALTNTLLTPVQLQASLTSGTDTFSGVLSSATNNGVFSWDSAGRLYVGEILHFPGGARDLSFTWLTNGNMVLNTAIIATNFIGSGAGLTNVPAAGISTNGSTANNVLMSIGGQAVWSSTVPSSISITNVYGTNAPTVTVANQSAYIPTNAISVSNVLSSQIATESNFNASANITSSNFLVGVNATASNFLAGAKVAATNGYSTNQTASTLTTLGNVAFGPSGQAVNILGSLTNYIGFTNAGSPEATNGGFEWIASQNLYTNRSTGAIYTNNGSSWLLRTNLITLYSIAGSSPVGLLSAINGALPAPGAYYSFGFDHNRMVDTGPISLTNISAMISTQVTAATNNLTAIITNGSTSGSIAVLNGFGTNTTLRFVTAGWGISNSVIANWSAAFGGFQNTIGTFSPGYSVIAGGLQNGISAPWSFIGGGASNTMSSGGGYNVIAGGQNNTSAVNVQYEAIGGGLGNSMPGTGGAGAASYNSIIGGDYNTISESTVAAKGNSILGGQSNFVSHTFSTAGGRNSNITNDATFGWSDGTPLNSITNSTVLFSATNGVGINTNFPAGYALNVNGPAFHNGAITFGAGATTNGGIYYLSNSFSLFGVTNNMPNFASWVGSSNGVLVRIYNNAGTPVMTLIP